MTHIAGLLPKVTPSVTGEGRGEALAHGGKGVRKEPSFEKEYDSSCKIEKG